MEVLIASVILTVALVGVAQLMAVSVRMHQIGRDSAQAARLAQDKFEELLRLDFTNPSLQINANNTLDSNVANYFDVTPNATYTRRWRVQAGPSGNANLRTVTVRVVPSIPMGTPFEVTTVLRSW